ncbi:MAG: hypothetical protein ACXVC6_09165 [Bacteroidia bacterium]
MNKGKFKKVLVVLFLLLLVAELVLRFCYGFCDAVLMKEDLAFEYIAQPNQDRHRFGKHIHYNEYSMRSDSVRDRSFKILGFGDSVINGGTLTDQDSLATTKLSRSLSSLMDDDVQVLNISAGSWGPDNCASYLNKYGDFNAKMILLVVSSHDAYDNMTFEKIVGVNPSFPDKQYKSAVWELIHRYLLPKIFKQDNSVELGINKQTSGSRFNLGFQKIYDHAQMRGIPMVIYLHPDKKEVAAKKYNEQGQEIIKFAKSNQIYLEKELDLGITESDFRDDIHLNDAGQRKMFNNLHEQIKEMVEGGVLQAKLSE